MPTIEARRLHEDIKSNKISSLYLLMGEEIYLIEEVLDILIEKGLNGSLRDFNYNSFYAQVDSIQAVRDAVETLPMMAEKRVVILKEAQHLKAKDLEYLLPIVEQPVDSTIFVVVAEKVDLRLKFYKKLSENGQVVKFYKPFEDQIPSWIQKIAQRHHKKLSPGSVEAILDKVGTNLIDIDNEMRKLSQYTGKRDLITEEDVEKVVSKVRVDTIFQLANAIGNNDRSQALVCLANLLEHGESPLGILALVSRHVRILTHIRDGLSEGLTQGQLSSRVGVPSFFIKQYIDQSKKWNESKIHCTYHALLQTDRALKSSPVTPHIWLENFIVQTCGEYQV